MCGRAAVAGKLPARAAAPSAVTGSARLVDDRSVLDRLEVRVPNLPPAPPGTRYLVWLRSEDQSRVEFAGELEPEADAVNYFDLLATYGEAFYVLSGEELGPMEL